MILGITTAPRPDGVQYLENTLASAKLAGFDNILIIGEPGIDINYLAAKFDVIVSKNSTQLGNYGNFKSLASSVLELSGDGELIVTAEDDVVFCNDAAKKISVAVNSLAGDDFGFFAAYSSSCHQEHLQPGSIGQLKTTSLWGACCLAWTKESLQALVDHKIFKKWRGLDDNRYSIGDQRIKHVDTCISKVMDKLDRKMYFCRPSLVKHIGTVSSLRKKAWTPDRNCNEFEDSKT